jgi:hypothetical protein
LSAAVFAAAPRGARAQPCAADTTALSLRASVDDEAFRARRWRYAWTGINAGFTAFSFASMPFTTREQWPELITSGVGSAISTALTVAWPLDVEAATTDACNDPFTLRARAVAAGRDQRDRQRWYWHVVNAGVGVAYFAILGAGFGHWESGALAGFGALAVGEAQTLTQPVGAATRFAPGFTW